MTLPSRFWLYFNTMRHLRLSQIALRIWRRVGGSTPLVRGYRVRPEVSRASIASVPVLPLLDFDPVFLGRYDVDALLDDQVELLHHGEAVDWNASWHSKLGTPLWRFNLHYCEYLLPLAAAALKSGDKRYLIKAKSIIDAWIVANPRSTGGVGWDSYVISMRVTQWLAFYGEVRVLLEEDSAFIDRMNQSLAEQYAFLADHLEKDILGNHYLENLKALVLLSCYFRDEATLRHLMPVLEEQIAEQILPDGMHFELSPMYHKVILECLMRIACTLQAGEWARDVATLCRLQDMCDCLYSLEHDADRTPLFNDSGDNVAKSRDALLACAREQFGLAPRLKDCLPDAGYYFLRGTIGETEVKVIFDAGRPGPEFAAGHAHCDMLSFEAFVGGHPWLVNTGTFAYQDARRLAFKRTAAHNAPQRAGVEQSECWAPFRMARMAQVQEVCHGPRFVEAAMRDHRGGALKRRIELTEGGIVVTDMAPDGARIVSSLRSPGRIGEGIFSEGELCPYAPEFGRIDEARRLVFVGEGQVTYHVAVPTCAQIPEAEGGRCECD